jgi:hypothetical protein
MSRALAGSTRRAISASWPYDGEQAGPENVGIGPDVEEKRTIAEAWPWLNAG